jgi:hypothetical protein
MKGFTQFFENNNVDSEIIHMYLNGGGVSVSDIGANYGKSETDVYRILRANSINPNRKGVHHEKVRSLSRLGWGIREISSMTGYSTRNVRYIIKREHGSI